MSRDWTTVRNELGTRLKRMVVACFRLLSLLLPGGVE